MDVRDTPGRANGQATPPGDFVFRTVLPAFMIVVAVIMLVVVFVAFRQKGTYFIFVGGMILVSAVGMMLEPRKPSRGRVLLQGGVVGAGIVGLVIYLLYAAPGNPVYPLFGIVTAVFTVRHALAAWRASRDAASTEDKEVTLP